MCLPAAIIGAIGTAVSFGGSLIQGQQAATMADAQAKAQEQQARSDAQASAFEIRNTRHAQDLARSSAIAQVGASGAGLVGSPTEVLAANAREGALDVAAIGYGSQLRQNSLRTQADITRYSGRQERVGSYISGLSNLFDPKRAIRFGNANPLFL